MADTKLGKFELFDGSTAFCLLIPTTPNSLDIQVLIIYRHEAFRGILSEQELLKQAQPVEMDGAKFRSTALGALGLGLQREELICEINDSCLTWKKSVSGHKVLYKLGSMALIRDEYSSAIEETLLASEQAAKSMRVELEANAATNRLLGAERDGAIRRLEDCQRRLEETERALFEKFVAVLNEKKRKIKQLQNELQGLIDKNGDNYRNASPEYEKPDSPLSPVRSDGSSTSIGEDTMDHPEDKPKNDSLMLDGDDDIEVKQKTVAVRTRVRTKRRDADSPVASTSADPGPRKSSRRPKIVPRMGNTSIDTDQLLDEI